MNANPRNTENGTADDQLTGVYAVDRVTNSAGGYLASAATVEVSATCESDHFEVQVRSAAGDTLVTIDRARHRIEGALEGRAGYTLVVSKAAA